MQGNLYDNLPQRIFYEMEMYCHEDMDICIKVAASGMVRGDKVPCFYEFDTIRVLAALMYFRYRKTLSDITVYLGTSGLKRNESNIYRGLSEFTSTMSNPIQNNKLYTAYVTTVDNLKDYKEFSKSIEISDGFGEYLELELGDKRLYVAAIALNSGVPLLDVCSLSFVTKTDLMNFYNKKSQEYASENR